MALAIYDLFYLFSSIFIFAIPLLWPESSGTILFTYSVPYLLAMAHIGMTGEVGSFDF